MHDFEQPLKIIDPPPKPKMSKKEAQQKAKELQEQIRTKMIKKEEEQKRQRERDRIKSGKEMVKNKRLLD